MKLQDYMIEATRAAMDEAFTYAKAVPEDKLTWKPMDAGRSVLELCQELTQCADWSRDILEKGAMDMSEEAFAAGMAEASAWKTPADCETAAREKLGRYFEAVKAYPDEKLQDTIDLPFGPGGSMKSFTMAEIVGYPHWNANYHLGQIAYIQVLYGDKDMH